MSPCCLYCFLFYSPSTFAICSRDHIILAARKKNISHVREAATEFEPLIFENICNSSIKLQGKFVEI